MTVAARFAAKPVAQREITITRTFDAPRALVFSMFTDAKHLAAWWGPHGWTNPKAEADPRPGGRILIHMQGPDGSTHPMGGVFDEILPHERIVRPGKATHVPGEQPRVPRTPAVVPHEWIAVPDDPHVAPIEPTGVHSCGSSCPPEVPLLPRR